MSADQDMLTARQGAGSEAAGWRPVNPSSLREVNPTGRAQLRPVFPRGKPTELDTVERFYVPWLDAVILPELNRRMARLHSNRKDAIWEYATPVSVTELLRWILCCAYKGSALVGASALPSSTRSPERHPPRTQLGRFADRRGRFVPFASFIDG